MFVEPIRAREKCYSPAIHTNYNISEIFGLSQLIKEGTLITIKKHDVIYTNCLDSCLLWCLSYLYKLP